MAEVSEKNTNLDYKKVMENYLDSSDWRVKESSTVTYSLGGLILSNSGAMTANYWLSEVYDDEIADAHRNADIHLHDLSMLSGYCFTGDTRVKTLDGKNPTLEELSANPNEKFWVFAYDNEKGEIVPALAENARKTRTVSRLVKVTLTDGAEIFSTEDHPYMLRDGSYKKAGELKPNTSLMPLYVSNGSKYCKINQAWYDGKNHGYLHRWIAEKMLGRQLEENEIVHHKNGDKHDNRPENLEVMADNLHRSMEIKKTMQTEEWKRSNANRLTEYNQSEEKREEVSRFAKNRNRDNDGIFTSFAYVKEADTEKLAYNHCVRKVETLNVKPTDVYDITVPKYHNFALDSGVFVHNCAGWSLKQLIKEGLGGVEGKITSSPAKHLSTLCNQMVNFLGILQNEWAGAQAFSSFDTYLAPFVKVDNLSYDQVKQCIQSFVFGLNVSSRWGSQPPFTNITLDWSVPDDLKNEKAIVGGKEVDFTYGDCQKEMDIVNKAFIEVFTEGDANGRGFQYPIPTYSITKDFNWEESENNKLLFEMAAKFGTPYFSNYINSDMKPSDIRSMCCRLRLDLRELRKKNGGYFGSGESTGSVGVVTINLPRIGYLAKDEKDFYARLDKMMDIAARSLDIKRKTITSFLERGLYPYTHHYLGGFENHFSTIGMVGMNEACLNAKWIGEDLSHEKAHKFAEDVLNYMRERLVKYQEEYKCLFNLEATPAESTAYRLAKHDVERYPDIITAAPKGETPYYTNSSQLPVGFSEDVFEALDLQDSLQTLYTSGTVFHTYLGERLQDWKSAAMLVRKIAENYKLPYFTLSPTYSICKNHGYLVGEVSACPICGEKTEIWSRITGYYRPISKWNDGKVKEFEMRKEYEPEHSHYVPKNPENEKKEEPQGIQGLDDGIYLLGTKVCPKCRVIKGILEDKGIGYTYLDASENQDLVEKLDIMQAPTVVKVANEKAEVIEGFEEIKKSLL